MSPVSSSEPDAWRTNEPRPFLTIEGVRATVAVSALGGDRFIIDAPDSQQVLEGFPHARERARSLARELD
jgi:hypothetical protein